jgi:hypothetical protein
LHHQGDERVDVAEIDRPVAVEVASIQPLRIHRRQHGPHADLGGHGPQRIQRIPMVIVIPRAVISDVLAEEDPGIAGHIDERVNA